MSSIFQTLCDFFGLSGIPADFAEFIPWFMQVMLAVCGPTPHGVGGLKFPCN